MFSKTFAKFLLLIWFLAINVESKAQYSIENGTIPPNFGKNENDVLICILYKQKAYNKYLIRNVEKNYFGKYIFVPEEEKHSKQYADTSIYKFAFDMKEVMKTSASGSTLTTRTFFMVDRTTWKRYGNGVTSSFWGAMITGYMTSLEKIRVENQGKK